MVKHLQCFLWVFLLIGISPRTIAQAASFTPKVVLLTSLPKTAPTLWHSGDNWLPPTLEKDFHQAFDHSGYRVEVKHSVNAATLAEVLQSPDTIAIFWASHAAAAIASPIGLDNLIVDVDGADVSAVFQKIHPNLKWLAVIGCNAQRVFDQWSKNRNYVLNPDLQIHAYNSVVPAEGGLIESMNASLPTLSDTSNYTSEQHRRWASAPHGPDWNTIPQVHAPDGLVDGQTMGACPMKMGLPISITRTPMAGIAAPMVEAQVFVNDEFLGILPESTQTQTQEFYLAQELLSISPEIRVDSRYAGILSARANFGAISFSSALASGQWKIFATPEGEPIGVSNEIFDYMGDMQMNPSIYEPFRCL